MARHGWKLSARWLALAAGLALLGAAVATATTKVDFSALGAAPWWAAPAMGLAILANLALTAALFGAVTRCFDADPPVDAGRMFQLICVSGVLNYLPLRPGLFGRAAYLKLRHQLPIRQSVLILVVTLAVGGIVLGSTALVVLAAAEQWRSAACAAVVVVLLLCSPLVGPVAQRLLRRPTVGAWTWLPLKIADMLVGGFKLWLALRVFGQTVTFEQALAVRAVGSVVDMLGLTPNGLGLREWSIGGLAALTGLTEGPHVAVAAALFERGLEAVVVVVTGLIAVAQLRRAESAPRRGCP